MFILTKKSSKTMTNNELNHLATIHLEFNNPEVFHEVLRAINKIYLEDPTQLKYWSNMQY